MPIRFPGETPDYRTARDELLEAERELRRHVEAVAAQRRRLPLGGAVPQDYVFEEAAADGSPRAVKLSELFEPGKDTLVLYSYMFGPAMEQPCPMCTSFLDALEGNAVHIGRRVSLAVAAKSPIARILDFTRARGWKNLRLVSSAGSTFNRDYNAEADRGEQESIIHVFVKRGEAVHHAYSSELEFGPSDEGQNPRHIDLMWPMWNVLDLTPGGRGSDFYPELSYG
jgi:predicted dithiol-disulfide oxidoreductase (DUF899 family)